MSSGKNPNASLVIWCILLMHWSGSSQRGEKMNGDIKLSNLRGKVATVLRKIKCDMGRQRKMWLYINKCVTEDKI